MDFISNAKNKIEKFPIYRRAPRVIMEPPTDSVEIAKMPSASKMDKGSLIQIIITPLSMLLVTILMVSAF